MLQRRLFNSLFTAAMILSFTIAFYPSDSKAITKLAKLTKVQLALNWKAEPQFGGFYAALFNGEFKKRNLNVDVQQGGSGTPTVQMLASHKTDFAIVSAEEILVSRDHGADVVALFAAYQTNPQGIMTHAERGFQSLKDVFQSDGILSWQSGLSYAQFLTKKYSKAPVGAASKLQKVPYTGGITGFLSSPKYSQQCFVTSEPLLAEKAGAKVKTFLVSEEGFNPYTTVLAIEGTRLKQEAQLASAMTEAVRAGWQAYLTNPEPTNLEMNKLNKAMDLATFAKSAEAQKPLIETKTTALKGLGVMEEARWKELASQLTDLGIVKKEKAPNEAFKNL